MTRFRPCIDLHNGVVKQIVGGTLTDSEDSLKTNFVSGHPPEWYASRYARDGIKGGHVIKLGPGNDKAAEAALAAFPGGLQVGGGINASNAAYWLDKGASHVIVTSCMFDDEACFSEEKICELVAEVGVEHVVIDLSCRRTAFGWTVAMNRWQTPTDLMITPATLDRLSGYCDEFLIHAADVEGLVKGIDEELVIFLGAWRESDKPITYAGGIARLEDFELIDRLSEGRVDATVGSALDIFGGTGVAYADLVEFNRRTPADY